MPKSYTRVPLDLKPEFVVEIDRACATLMLQTGERQTRTSFIVQAVRKELERMAREAAEKEQSAAR